MMLSCDIGGAPGPQAGLSTGGLCPKCAIRWGSLSCIQGGEGSWGWSHGITGNPRINPGLERGHRAIPPDRWQITLPALGLTVPHPPCPFQSCVSR